MSAVINRPGPKPGQRHSGQFRKGDDPRRPHGQPIQDGITLAAMARKHTRSCVALWLNTMRNEAAPLPMRIKASELIMDRGYGRAVSVIESHSRPLHTLTLAELEAIAAGEQPRFPVTIEGEAVPLAVEHQQCP